LLLAIIKKEKRRLGRKRGGYFFSFYKNKALSIILSKFLRINLTSILAKVG